MKRPFCTINKAKHQLYLVDGVIRFVNDGRPKEDANALILDYSYHKSKPLAELLDYYTHTGSSYELVWSRFSSTSSDTIINEEDGKVFFRLYV